MVAIIFKGPPQLGQCSTSNRRYTDYPTTENAANLQEADF